MRDVGKVNIDPKEEVNQMDNQTASDLVAFIAYGQCFSLKDAVNFVKEKEKRELTKEELERIQSVYEHYRHFGF